MTSSSRKTRVFLYDEPSSKNLELDKVADYIRERTGLKVERRREFFANFLKGKDFDVERVAKELATFRIKDLEAIQHHEPQYGEVMIEKRLLLNPSQRPTGILYDGIRFHSLLQSLIPSKDKNMQNLHIVLTGRLIGTFDENDMRYHARTIICGYPCVISTSGIVEAPAKPRGFYAVKQRVLAAGIDAYEAIKEQYAGEFIDYDDPRMTDVVKGYAMQALFYHVFGEAFCQERKCRLFNAHWQSELIEAQLSGDVFCPRHEKMLKAPSK